MPEAIVVTREVRIPASAIETKAVRSAGPGGQNVNRVASKVVLRVDVDAIEGLTTAQRARLRALAEGSLAADGRLQVTSQLTRDQPLNLEDARGKVRALVKRALVRPKRRVKTRPTRASRERRLEGKSRTGEKKRERRWRADD